MPETKVATTVADLIRADLITVPSPADGEYLGALIEAELQVDGSFIWNGHRYGSPSAAASFALAAALGRRTIGRQYLSVNGWNIWNVQCPDGHKRLLADVRRMLASECGARGPSA